MDTSKSTEKPARPSDAAPLRTSHQENAPSPSSSSHHDPSFDSGFANRREANQKLANPLAGLSTSELTRLGEEYCREAGLFESEEDLRAFRLGAVLAAGGHAGEGGKGYDVVDGLTTREKEVLVREETHKWSQPKMLYWVIVICSLCAAVQGMDETVVNGAQTFYKVWFGIGNSESERDTWLLGLVNSAPYLCCAVLGCWLTEPMNNKFGRKGTVLISCAISALACFWQGFANTWYHMFIARFVLGLGIGPKSATTPIFAAECAPPKLRGALVMQWQMWTAFGIMVGYAADLAFFFVPDAGVQLGLNWRLMMGSAMIPAVVVCALIPMSVESPRWYLSKNRHADAFAAMCKLRFEKVQAARDLFYAHTLLKAEREVDSATASGGAGKTKKNSKLRELFTVRRNRNAVIASELVMFMQQFCGVNVIAYYSSEVFIEAGIPVVNALAASLGFGIINFLFAIPAIYTIDTFGRRNLLLVTFPLMSLCLLFTGFSFWIPKDSTAHIACIALGIYLFGVVYSPGEGPVPFTYSAEAYPLYLRPIGMSLATATTWFFNFILAVTWPSLLRAFKPQGAFGWYAGWNIMGFIGVLFLMPETKEKTLEELDEVFGVPLRRRIGYGWAQVGWFVKRCFLFQRNAVAPEVPTVSVGEGLKETGLLGGKGEKNGAARA